MNFIYRVYHTFGLLSNFLSIVSARIRRVKDGEIPLAICLSWELDNVNNYRLVLQENETGEIDVSRVHQNLE